MAITSTQQTEILKIVAGLFNAAPGGTNLNDLANAVSGGMTIKQLANVLASNTLFTNGIMAGKVTTDAQAAVLMNNFGLVADSTTTSAGSQALAYFKSQIDAKVGFGDIVYNAVTFLSGSSVPPEFTTAATLLANKALVAEQYSATNSSSSLSTLQGVVSQVKGDKAYTAADVTAALASVGDTVAPTVTAPTAAIEYNENQAAGATLATIAATDNTGVASFQIASGDTSGFFAIDATGKISLTAAGLKSSANDFETTPNTVTLGITATDGAGNKSAPVNVILNVKDVDDVAPSFTSAVINGTTATISFSEALSITAATPAIADFAVGIKGGSGSIGVNAVQVTGSSVVLTLGRAPATGETFTVAYTQGTNALQDAAGNKVATFTGKDVVVDTTAPVVTASQTFTYVESVSDGKGGLTGPVNDTSDVIGTVAATDNTGVTSFAIASGNDKGWFAIDSTGKLTLTTAGLTAASNDFEVLPNSFSLGITAKDGANNTSAVGTVTVSVTNNTADDPAVGSTFTLTTGIDAATSKTSVDGILSDTASERTWSLTDQVSGTSATTDSMNARIIGDASGTAYSGLQTSAIENFSFAYVDGNDAAEANTLSASGFSGAAKIAVKNSSIVNTTSTTDDSLTFNNVAKGTVLELADNSLQLNVTANFVTAATEGTADTVSITAAGGSTGDVIIGTGFETVTVSTGGAAASKFQSLQGNTTVKTINVTGIQDLTITDNLLTNNTSLTTFDASGNSGAVSVTATGASTLTAKGGSGTADALTLSLGSSVSSGMAVSGFETVALQATATASVTGSLITGATTTNVKGSTTNISTSTLTLNEFAAGTGINIVGTGKNEAQFVNAVTLVQTGAASGTADSVAIKLSNGGVATTTANTVTAGLITAANIETVTLNVADFAKVDGSITIANAKALTLTGAAELDLDAFNGGSALASIDASTYTGKLTFGTLTGVTDDLTFKGSTGIDSVTNASVAANKTQTFNLGAGADTMAINEVLANANATLTVNGDAGDDVLTVALANGTPSVGKLTFNGGADTDTLRVTGTGDTLTATISGIEKINLEATTNAATLDLTVASGFAETVLVTDVSGQNEIIKLNVAAGGSINGSNLSFLGWTEGTDVLQYVSTTSGNESFTFGAKTSAGGAITETYKVVAANGIDNITGFTAGANEDIIDATALTAFLNGGTTALHDITATNTAADANDNLILLNYGTYWADAAAVAADAVTTTWGSGLTNATAHVLIAYQTASGSAVRIAEATVTDGGDISAATDLVILTGVTSVTSLVISNVVMDAA